MNKMVLNPKAGVKLRKVGNQYMIVEANEENANMSDVYSLNHTRKAAPLRICWLIIYARILR